MKQILVAESSQTRRRALTTLLAQRGYAVTALPGLHEAYALLRRMHPSTTRCDAVVLGWPEHPDGSAEDVFGLLYGERFEHLPVLLMAESADVGAVNWRMTRPRTALLLWSDFQEAPQALDDLLRPEALPRESTEPAGTPLRVLLVDDSPTVRAAYAKLLQKEGYQVETAASVAEGLDRVTEHVFDIAIVDYYMPRENGTVLIEALRMDPTTRHILVTTLTGTYSDAIITESLAAGAVDCLFKSEAKELFLARLASLARTVRDRHAIDEDRRRLEGILSSVGDGVYGVDASGVIRFVNPAALELLGHGDAADLVGRDAFDALHPLKEDGSAGKREACFLSRCYAEGDQVTAWPTVFWTSTHRAVPVECTVYPLIIDNQRKGSVVAFRDVSARRLLEDELRWQAEHDSLTQLHNRAWFQNQLMHEIDRLKRSEQTSLLLFIDLDRFKYVNDTAGHSAGDQLLQEVSRRLRSRLRGSDILARMGGDEYAVILRNVRVEDVGTLADGFRRALVGAPFVHEGKSYRITLSIGVAKLDSSTLSPQEAMAHADIACHQAKRSGRDQTTLYEPGSGQRAGMERDLGWSARLEEALTGEGFVLCYQPILPLADLPASPQDQSERDRWTRQLEQDTTIPALYEVLLRLRDAHGELVSPNAFLPAAERFGLIRQIDRWVIDRALRTLRETEGHQRPVHLSINLSGQSLESNDLVEFITSRVVKHDVDPERLVFEITESHSIRDVEGVRRLVSGLRELGCRIAVDDFGTGFSTFAYLKQLQADILKIDGSLLCGLPEDVLDRTVVSALTAIARIAGKRTVAECVENPAALAALKACGVDYVQGYAVGMPRLSLSPSAPILVDAFGNQHLAAG
ncbi:MAG TPA: EAL domain-containing protein [Xanthomonadaceae bacterium]|nr:EAL domain-containing protein [Xanthomonadaceae bacterium]